MPGDLTIKYLVANRAMTTIDAISSQARLRDFRISAPPVESVAIVEDENVGSKIKSTK